MAINSFLRYPGGKHKIKQYIIEELLKFKNKPYRELFCGGGSIGIEILKHKMSPIWFNDKDPGIASIWLSIIHHPDLLKKKIETYTPSVESFFEFKRDLLNNNIIDIDIAFKKIVIHQISYSGLGTKAGGPIGGLSQTSKYDVGCRWSSTSLCNKIDNLHKLFKGSIISCLDFEELLDDTYVMYLDPPYYIKGSDLYQCSFTENDHIRLAKRLMKLRNWVLSYDDCSYIRELYEWATIKQVDVNYTITSSRNKKELIIVNKS